MDDSFSGDEERPLLPTAPVDIGVSLRGFEDRASAERFGKVIAEVVRSISCYINMERLDGITVAFDYDEALAQLDRGYQASRPLTRTASERLAGVAMTPAVLRDGAVKSHMVFHAPFVLRLEDAETEGFRHALYLVAHECGHVEDLKYRDEAFPGTILQRPAPSSLIRRRTSGSLGGCGAPGLSARVLPADGAKLLRQGIAAGEIPPQNVELSAAAIVGAIAESMVGPLSPIGTISSDEDLIATLVRFCRRSLGVSDTTRPCAV